MGTFDSSSQFFQSVKILIYFPGNIHEYIPLSIFDILQIALPRIDLIPITEEHIRCLILSGPKRFIYLLSLNSLINGSQCFRKHQIL